MRSSERLLSSILVLMAIAASGCGSDTDSTSAANGSVSAQFLTPGVSDSALTLAKSGQQGISISQTGMMSAGDVSHNTAAQLSSFQLYITSIKLCESLTISGSGYSGETNCSYLIGSSSSDNAYSTYTVAAASADTTSTNWVDLMSKTSIDSFRTNNAGTLAPGTYNYVVMETRKPMKLNASWGTSSYEARTCSGGTVSSTGSAESLRETVTVSNMLASGGCTKSLVTLGGQGGGRYFKFSSPVTVSSGTSYVLNLAFDPVGVVAGGAGSGWGSGVQYVDGTRSMVVSPLSLSPVLVAQGEKVVRERYEIATSGALPGTLIVNLYYAGTAATAGSGTILSVETRLLHNSSATSYSHIYNPYSVTVNSDGTIDLKDYAGNNMVAGLKRVVTSTVTLSQTGIPALSTSSASGTSTYIGATEF